MKSEAKQKGIKLIETSVTVSSSLNLGRKKQLKLQEEEEGKQEEEQESLVGKKRGKKVVLRHRGLHHFTC